MGAYLREIDALWLHGPDPFSSPVKESLHHHRFIGTFRFACDHVSVKPSAALKISS
jgi:hypothetical protein